MFLFAMSVSKRCFIRFSFNATNKVAFFQYIMCVYILLACIESRRTYPLLRAAKLLGIWPWVWIRSLAVDINWTIVAASTIVTISQLWVSKVQTLQFNKNILGLHKNIAYSYNESWLLQYYNYAIWYFITSNEIVFI